MSPAKRSLDFFFILLAVSVILLAGCNSSGNIGFENSAVNFLGEKNSVYMKVPVKEYPELTKKIMMEKASLSESNASMVVSRVTNLYAGLDFSNGGQKLEMAAEGNFPSSFAGLALTEKRGWKKKSHSVQVSDSAGKEKSVKFKYFDGGAYCVSFPSGSLVLVSSDVTKMLDRYATKAVPEESPHLQWFENAGEFDKDILFYLNEPGSLLVSFVGDSLSNWFSSAYGKISKCGDGEYNMEINLSPVDERRKNLAVTMMTLAGLSVIKSGNNELKIPDLRFSEEQIADFVFGGAN